MDRLLTATLATLCVSMTAAWGALLVWGTARLILG
jgi:hypothetical protein